MTMNNTIGSTDLDRNGSVTVRLRELQRELSLQHEELCAYPKVDRPRSDVRAMLEAQLEKRPLAAVAAALAAGWVLGSVVPGWARKK
jgi:hypothetical protein